MTDIKKKGQSRAKRLQLRKETLKDLVARSAGQVKGGSAACQGNTTACPTVGPSRTPNCH
jgi:hypothetical protein